MRHRWMSDGGPTKSEQQLQVLVGVLLGGNRQSTGRGNGASSDEGLTGACW